MRPARQCDIRGEGDRITQIVMHQSTRQTERRFFAKRRRCRKRGERRLEHFWAHIDTPSYALDLVPLKQGVDLILSKSRSAGILEREGRRKLAYRHCALLTLDTSRIPVKS